MALFRGEQGRIRSGWRAAIFILLLVTCLGLGAGLAATMLAAWPLATVPALAMRWLGLTLGALIAHAVMLRLVDRQPWEYVGLGRAHYRPRVVVPAMVVGALPISFTSGALLALGWLTIVPAPGSALGAHVASLLLLFLAAALFEELVLRGYLLSALRDGIGAAWAAVSTSVVFGLLHLGNPGVNALSVMVVIVAGIFLAAVRFATGSLYAAWAAHAAWNIVMALVLHTAVSGTSIAPPGGWRVADTGPDWATGGVWGPEGGVPAAGALLVATWYLIRRRHASASNSSIAQPRGESVE